MWLSMWLGCAPEAEGPLMLLDRYGAPIAALDSAREVFVDGRALGALRDGVLRLPYGAPPVVILLDGEVPPGAGPDETRAAVFEREGPALALPARQVEIDGDGRLACQGGPCGRFEPPGAPDERHAALLAAVFVADRYRGVQAHARLKAEEGLEEWVIAVAGLPQGDLAETVDCTLPTGDETCRGQRIGQFAGDRVTLPARVLDASDTVDAETCTLVWRDLPPVVPFRYPHMGLFYAKVDSPFGPLELHVTLTAEGGPLDCRRPEAAAALAAVAARLAGEYEADLPK
jgi:hypothetical protein